MKPTILFIDTEVSGRGIIEDIGAIYEDGNSFHSASFAKFSEFISKADFLCGHNIIHHDLKYVLPKLSNADFKYIDTLYPAPLLFPNRPNYALSKDEKLFSEELNNPLNDSKKAQMLFNDEAAAFLGLDERVKRIYYGLLGSLEEFSGFFEYLNYSEKCGDLSGLIHETFFGKICENADIEHLIEKHPAELAYALAVIGTENSCLVTPKWLSHNFPGVESVIRSLCGTCCEKGCAYCDSELDIIKKLNKFFGFSEFRTYDGEPLQENAARAAVNGKSLLAIFPTAGGKSVTFQLPALMAGQAERGLTVVISPLQSLMKDQIDNLEKKGISEAATINGMLSPVERTTAIEHVKNGNASILYISPEQLRSRSIEQMLLSRNVVRFVIDEAHCFSAWGQDFRVDYLYIGDFISNYIKEKHLPDGSVPVSCFTATAKQRVINDILEYFSKKLGLELELFGTDTQRKNLSYKVYFKNGDNEKYAFLRSLIERKNCPAIVYVSRTKKTHKLAERLTGDGIPALPYNGKMDSNDKRKNQDDFNTGKVNTIVATSAFGMGVDKEDVGLVVHYNISDSLENYVQEAGRAGRNPRLNAECYILFDERDIDAHFLLLNQTKVGTKEIQQVWSALKKNTKNRHTVYCSPLEIARSAGWNDSVSDVETRVNVAVSALEQAGYLERGHNIPRVYATSITVKNMEEARDKIEASKLFPEEDIDKPLRIIKCLISERSRSKANSGEAESRIDYLADILSLEKKDVINYVNLMRQAGVLADNMDMSAYIYSKDLKRNAVNNLKRFKTLEEFLLMKIFDGKIKYNLKELNGEAQNRGNAFSNVKRITTILNFLTIKEYIAKERVGDNIVKLQHKGERKDLMKRFELRCEIAEFTINKLCTEALNHVQTEPAQDKTQVQFSIVGILNDFNRSSGKAKLEDVEDALLYLSRIGSMDLEGGFLVLYNRYELTRRAPGNAVYESGNYRTLEDYYMQKIRQIHMVREYAYLMNEDNDRALKFVQDYFQADDEEFIKKYFKSERANEINMNISPTKYHEIVDGLSEAQKQIIDDNDSKYIVVAAGPGSGKTRTLVYKLAALMMLGDAKHEQFLMLTFSRAAVSEFKKRLYSIIGGAANFIEIKTFHSYCFDLLGRIGSLEESNKNAVIREAVEMIKSGEAEQGRITKTILLLDEAQDIDEEEYNLILTLMEHNDNMKIVAVGDDDQNIFEWRNASSKYMRSFIEKFNAEKYELTENYRSVSNVVSLANWFISSVPDRMKTTPITAVNPENGIVEITCYSPFDSMDDPIANEVKENPGGKTCVLTISNIDAYRICALLNEKGVRARLINADDGFELRNLQEIGFFLEKIDADPQRPAVISSEIWENAKQALNEYYQKSECLINCNKLISAFEKSHPNSKYRSDLENFINQSNFDDFDDPVYISTIHKAKGREFDNVYMMLKYTIPDNVESGAEEKKKYNEMKRCIYVGMTRAKKELHIHCSMGSFRMFNTPKDLPGINKRQGQSGGKDFGKMTLICTLRDIYLDFFLDKTELIGKLHSGDRLTVEEDHLTAEIDGKKETVAKFSKRFFEDIPKGCRFIGAKVRYIVAWKKDIGNEEEKECLVLLPEIYFERKF